MDGDATKVLAAVAAVVAAAACFCRLRAQQLAVRTREIGELCEKLAQQQAPPAPPAPVAQEADARKVEFWRETKNRSFVMSHNK